MRTHENAHCPRESTRVERGLLVGLALACAAGLAVPELWQHLLGAELAQARDPAGAARAVPWALGIAGAFFAAGALWYHPLWALGGRAIERCTALAPRHFAGLVLAVASAERLAVACIPTGVGTSDSIWYDLTARSLASGHGLAIDGVPTAYRPPGYSWLLARAYAVFGEVPAAAWLWGTLATVVLLSSVYALARMLYDERVARIATLGLALYPGLALKTGILMSDLVFAAGLTAWLFGVLRGPRHVWSSLLLGFALGLLSLVRSVGPLFLFVAVFVWMLPCVEIRKTALHLVLLAFALAVPTSLWASRNAEVFGVHMLDTNMGLNLWIGNHPGASGGYVDAPLPPGQPEAQVPDGEGEHGAQLAYARAAVDYVRHQPLRAIALWPSKLFYLFSSALSTPRIALAAALIPIWLKYGIYALSQLAYVALLLLVIARVASWRRRDERPSGAQWTSVAVAAVVCAVAILTFGQDRFRIPLLPWMAIEAAVWLTRAARNTRQLAR